MIKLNFYIVQFFILLPFSYFFFLIICSIFLWEIKYYCEVQSGFVSTAYKRCFPMINTSCTLHMRLDKGYVDWAYFSSTLCHTVMGLWVCLAMCLHVLNQQDFTAAIHFEAFNTSKQLCCSWIIFMMSKSIEQWMCNKFCAESYVYWTVHHLDNWVKINVTHEITQYISHKLLRMDVLTSETCWTLYKEIIKQVTSSWSLFTQFVQNSRIW